LKTGTKILLGSSAIAALLVAVPIITSALDDKATGDKMSFDFESLDINFKKLSITSLPGTLKLKATNPLKKVGEIESLFLDILIDGNKLATVSKQKDGNSIKIAPGTQQIVNFNFSVSPINFLFKIGADVVAFIKTKKINLPTEALIKGTLTFNGHVVDYDKTIPLKKV
jgi:hypothetical protein